MPADAYRARPKATPGNRDDDTHDRVRGDVVDQKGRITLRISGRMHHIAAIERGGIYWADLGAPVGSRSAFLSALGLA